MSANVILTTTVERWERRRQVSVILEALPYALLPGLAAGTALAIYARLRPGPADTVSVLAALGGALIGVAALLAWVWLRRKPPVESARWFDVRFGLNERVSTALELLDGRISADEGLVTHQVADAEQTAATVNAAQLLPFSTDWRVWVLNLALLAVLAFCMLVIAPVSAVDDAHARERAAIDAAAAEVSDIIQDIAADPNLTDEQRGPLLEALQTQLDTLRDPNITLDEAIATLGEIETGFSERADELQTALQQQQTAEAAATAALDQRTPDTAASLQNTIEALSDDLETMTPDQMQAAASALENAANALNQTNPEAAQAMRDAAEALRSGDMQSAQQALQQASSEAGAAEAQRAQQQAQRNTMQDSAQQTGKAQQQAAREAGSEGEQGQQGEEGQGEGQAGEGQNSDSAQGMLGEEGDLLGERGRQPGMPSDNSGEGDSGQESPFGRGGDGQGDAAGDLTQDASASDQQRSDNRDTPNNPDGTGERQYEEVFAPRFSVQADGDDELRLGADPGDTPLTEGDFQDNPTGVSVVPYNQVFSNYADAASRALESDYIPLGMRDVVRDYFSSLDPNTP